LRAVDEPPSGFRREMLALAAAHQAGRAAGLDRPVPLEPGTAVPERFAGLVFRRTTPRS